MITNPRIAVVGVGAVGSEIIRLLIERKLPYHSIRVFARSSRRELIGEIAYDIEKIEENSLDDIDIAILAGGDKKEDHPGFKALERRKTIPGLSQLVVIDNGNAFRMDHDVPLVIPEINSHTIHYHEGMIANPNCSTIIMLVPLFPLYEIIGVKRVHATTYQAASGAGQEAMDQLKEECVALGQGKQYSGRTVIPHQYAFNLFPHNSPFNDGSKGNKVKAGVGYCEEEWKMIVETEKIVGNHPHLAVNATCVRVPVSRAHSEALNIEFTRTTCVEEIYAVLKTSPGVEVDENPAKNCWAMPIGASGKDAIFAGRVRKDVSRNNTYDIWVVGDQLRKGAALNAVQIAEILVKEG